MTNSACPTTPSTKITRKSQGCYKEVIKMLQRKLQGCYKESYKNVTMKSQGCNKAVIRMLREVLRMLQGSHIKLWVKMGFCSAFSNGHTISELHIKFT